MNSIEENGDKTINMVPTRHRRRRAALHRIGFSISEAARALGVRPPALRRLVERHAVDEGDERVARLTGGLVAHRRKGFGRWLVILPADLQAKLNSRAE